ncbi:DUF5821 family protein [Haladaptatus sp. DYF46]|uniref:transcriptional regulator TbsP n=1 Tax=Haladaptatus sp. DYF46 TaxID=2886041 RepID=UPI001E340B7E|nr:DUF5821 family protein [Haladaptatus sp. DYF46]
MSTEVARFDQELDKPVQALFEETDSVLIVNPPSAMFRTIIKIATSFDDDRPDLQVLATSEVLKSSTEDFILASQVADLVEQDLLELRTATDIARSSLLVSDYKIVTVISLDTELTGLQSGDEELVENTQSAFFDAWEGGDSFSLRTPPLSRVRKTLREELGDEVENDFMMVFDSVDTIPGEEDAFDEVAIALLVGANNEILLYDISKWGEDSGVASKATFSRIKTRLVDRGLIETEKEPIDVGRPRLRLLLVPDHLEDVENLTV